jgi:RND superfamily putative drug exporter
MDFIKYRWLVVGIWILVITASVPALQQYTLYIDYSTSSSALSHYESSRAQALLSSASPQNESLLVVVSRPNNISQTTLANMTLGFQNSLASSEITNYSTSQSAFSSYASFIDTILNNYTNLIRAGYSNFSQAADDVYSFPYEFLVSWNKTGYTSISTALQMTNYSGTPFEKTFIDTLNATFTAEPHANPALIVQNSTLESILSIGTRNPYYFAVLKYLNVTDYYNSKLNGFALLINSTQHPLSVELLDSIIKPGDPGTNYVLNYGLEGAPSFILQQFVDKNYSVYLIDIIFNVRSGYVGPGGGTPSQTATPLIRTLAARYFGLNAQLTGNGAISYDTQKITANSGIIFAFTFVFLAVAVAITLRSYIAPLISLLIVSVSTLLGYVSIYITGVLLFRVNFIVTYTLTAVVLGVATDYLVFLLHRYREELRKGLDKNEAIRVAVRNAGPAILVSGLTVASSLGTFAFISGLQSWGPVLFIGVLFTVCAELTLLPSIAAILGPRLFIRRTLSRFQSNHKNSVFYRAAALSISRKSIVIGLIIILAIPAVYAWFTLPTSYNFNEGLPSNLPSVKALNLVQDSFGANLIYPNYIVVNMTGQVFASNGSLTQNAIHQLEAYYREIASVPGIVKVIGPVSSNATLEPTSVSKSFIFDDGARAYFIAYDNYSPYTSQAISVVKTLRSNSAFLVGGLTSTVIDEQSYSSSVYTELEILIVIVIAVIIGASFKSFKYPLIALSGVFISITWTTGILYLVAKYMLNEELLYLIPLILFVILMSLGNDYTVFIISRIREYQKKDGFAEGILRGMSSSASVVTSLGIILAVSLGSLGLAPISFLRQLGLAFIISLLLDTFVIRTFYFPAMIHLLKEGNSKKDE